MLWHSSAGCLWRAFCASFCLACEFQGRDSRNRWLNFKSTIALFSHFYSFPFLKIPNTSVTFWGFCFLLQLSSFCLFFLNYFLFNSKYFPHIFLPPQPRVSYFPSLPQLISSKHTFSDQSSKGDTQKNCRFKIYIYVVIGFQKLSSAFN